uniref:Reverse transcriptase-rnase h-integrase n=1 Tax=Moniliophthora roreri TaxID=221103 RepID=A0A0W0FJH8_MONRR
MIKRPMKPFIGIFDETKESDTGILDKVEDDEVLIRSFIKGEEDSDEVRINAKLSASQILAQAHEVKAKPLEELLPAYLSDYTDRFEKKKAERFPPSRPYDHAIDLKPDFKPRDCKIYSLSPKEQIEQDKFLDKNLRKGYIRPSKSLMASPFFFVAKKEAGALRPCQDYRDLNNGTIKNRYPLPLVTDLVDKLKTAKVFTKLDLQNGYNNIRIKDGDQWKAAFKTPRGLFEPTVMFFGLTNSPATFQAFMNDILKDFIDEGLQVLERLRENDLYLKPEKCEFEVKKTLFLGMVITPGHILMDKTKLAGIKDWEAPKTIKGVRSFLGFVNFYRKFIGKYAELARPLHELTKKNTKFEWTKPRDIAFNVLKAKFLQRPILQMPDNEKPFVIEADASKWATGAVLKQLGSDGELHPCGYISHAFTATERNYEIYDRELLAITNALKAWEHYLLGGAHPVTVLSDHKNLTYFRTAQKLNRRQARLNLIDEEENDNENIVMLPDKLFVNVINTELKTMLEEALPSDEFLQMTIESLIEKGTPPIKSSLQDWRTKGNLLFYKDRIYVPNDPTLQRLIVKTIHEALPHGHPGQWNTIDQVQRDYWWPGMTKFIKTFVDGCAACQQMKVNTHPTRTPIQPIGGHKDALPFQIISMDLITDLPKIADCDSILVVVDHAATKGNSPFYLTMGYHPQPLPTVFEKTTVPSVEKRVAELKKLREETSALLDIAARRVKERSGRSLDKFEKGQKVWLEGKNLSLGYPSPKLSPKREGPFEITEVLGPVTYRLKLPFQWRIHPVFHAGLLSPFKETDIHGPNFLEPPPDIVEGQEEHEVEAIIGH